LPPEKSCVAIDASSAVSLQSVPALRSPQASGAQPSSVQNAAPSARPATCSRASSRALRLREPPKSWLMWA
jgi:hypothetical protein